MQRELHPNDDKLKESVGEADGARCNSATPIKRTAVERMVNTQILFLFAILLALSIGSAIGTTVRTVSIACIPDGK